MKMELTIKPDFIDLNFLTDKINEETTDFGTAYPFAFFMRDENGKIIAGCNGSIIFGCIYTDQLWVDKSYRMQGLGTQLMEAVHDYARQSSCQIATVNTMNFQHAELFYKKLGYEVDFRREGYIHGSHCLFLKKIL